ncbi:MAG: type II toxin-antitoxin system RelE/ParE family toxin [Firmicutes bacterium]|nr:type II toxin-antitoxin system RelE/ParE family toxin [Bacillota bacterium]
MVREFIALPIFEKQWLSLGLDDNDLMELQSSLLDTPRVAPVIPSTGGVRKIRFAFGNKGKSGSVRVLYVDLEDCTIIYLLFAYSKNTKDNITEAEKKTIKELVQGLKNDYKGGHHYE